MRATDRFMIVPNQVPLNTTTRLEKWFKIKATRTNIGCSILTGSLVCANSHNVLVPHFVWDQEIVALKGIPDLNISIMKTKRTAYGNLVLTNDHGAIADPRFKRSEIKMISDALNVEVVQSEIGGLPYVGSLAVATNKGIMVHPLIKSEEESILKQVLKVRVGAGTVNCGIPYIGTGLIGNSHMVVAGQQTTGPEIFMISEALSEEEKE